MVRSIYSSVKQVSDTLFSPSGNAFRTAVLVQWPRPEVWTIGFVTGTPGGDVQPQAMLPSHPVAQSASVTPAWMAQVPPSRYIRLIEGVALIGLRDVAPFDDAVDPVAEAKAIVEELSGCASHRAKELNAHRRAQFLANGRNPPGTCAVISR